MSATDEGEAGPTPWPGGTYEEEIDAEGLLWALVDQSTIPVPCSRDGTTSEADLLAPVVSMLEFESGEV